jgi:hypothetical protein
MLTSVVVLEDASALALGIPDGDGGGGGTKDALPSGDADTLMEVLAETVAEAGSDGTTDTLPTRVAETIAD